ncbi:MAG: hypothetical protein RMK45_02735 [Armatimonadota bacterium]|nr:hypothetical protein [Armatimonadota bacterium]
MELAPNPFSLPGSDEIPVQILASNEDEAIIIAQQYQAGQPSGIVTIKVFALGHQPVLAWYRQVGLPSMQFRDAALLPDGSILIAASYAGVTGKDWFLIHYASTGAVLDARPIDGGFGDDEPISVALSPTGDAYIGGYLMRPTGGPEGVIYAWRGGYFVYRVRHNDASYIVKLATNPAGGIVGIGAKRDADGFDPFAVFFYSPTAGAVEVSMDWIRARTGGAAGDYYPVDFAIVPSPGVSQPHMIAVIHHVPLIGTQSARRIIIAQRSWRRHSDGAFQPVQSAQVLSGVPAEFIPVTLQLAARGNEGYDWALLSLRPLPDNPPYAGRSVSFGSWNPDPGVLQQRRGPYFGYFVYLLPPVDIPTAQGVYRGGYFVFRIPNDPDDPGSSGEAILYGTRTPASPRMEALFMTSPPRADVTLDCCVNNADLLAVLFAFGSEGELLEDTNLDGVVNNADLLAVLFNFGQGCSN